MLMRTLPLVVLLAAVPSVGCRRGHGATHHSSSAPSPAPKTDDEKTIYAIGLTVARNLTTFQLTPEELALVKRGLDDATRGKPAVDVNAFGPKLLAFSKARQAKRAEREKAAAREYLERAAKEPGAIATPSGLVIRTLTPGSGATPTPADKVRVHYVGKLLDGTTFDSSIQRGEPAEFPLGGVIPCWTEGLQRMKVGEKAQLVCPASIAYGDQGHPPGIPGGATLVFEVELLRVNK